MMNLIKSVDDTDIYLIDYNLSVTKSIPHKTMNQPHRHTGYVQNNFNTNKTNI